MIQTTDGSYAAVGWSDSTGLLVKMDTSGRAGCVDSALTVTTSVPTITASGLTLTHTSISLVTTALDTLIPGVVVPVTNFCKQDPCGIEILKGLTLCGNTEPLFNTVDINTITNCSDSSFFIMNAAIELQKVYKDSLLYRFDSAYRAKCMQAYRYEQFTVKHAVSEYHHTLYYYDQAGNLLKTVPPAGVCARYDSLWLDSVKVARFNQQTKVPAHKMATQYRYNTLNQVVSQQTPDAGKSAFWYDRLGRLVISQNAKQKAASSTETGRNYSYTLYDYLGRIAEVGQIKNAGTSPMVDSISRRPSNLGTWLTTSVAGKEQITQTNYDTAYSPFTVFSPSPLVQKNLRNRVSYTTYTLGNNTANYNHGTFYTYDIHGNVDTLLQDFGSDSGSTRNHMNATLNRWKKIVYGYDLISGKVNYVSYQRTMADQFFHRYRYDAENRLTQVETSKDSVIWEKDAQYEYYRHGPLARMVYGDLKVQGIDYAYTIQGWLKGVNSTSLNPMFDMGGDGDSTRTNRYVATDIYSFGLNYNSIDYRPIDSTYNPFAIVSTQLSTDYRPLYNGNISSMSSNLAPLYTTSTDTWRLPQLYDYTYDQLNRLTAMDSYYGLDQGTNAWSGMTKTKNYRNRFQYDANGNIQKQVRWGIESTYPGTLDSMRYVYETGTNKLQAIEDSAIGWAPYRNDFAYDEIGNLIKDSTFNIPLNGIQWNVYGKMTDVRTNNVGMWWTPYNRTRYMYDGAGNRVGKLLSRYDGEGQDYTWYVRDASGNIMAIYVGGGDSTDDKSSMGIFLEQLPLYGSSRLGMLRPHVGVNGSGITNPYYDPPFPSSYVYGGTKSRGYKLYELTNHLGNVLATVYDVKLGVPKAGDSSLIATYKGFPSTVNDYSAFGMLLPGRDTFDPQYRWGFNGKENELDFRGFGVITDYGERIYNARLGKFLSVDPITKDYPELTPYQFASNRPIDGIDLDGLEYTASATLDIDKGLGKPVLSNINIKDTKANIKSIDIIYRGQNYSFSNFEATTLDRQYIGPGKYANAPENTIERLSTWLSNAESGQLQDFDEVFVSDMNSKERLYDEICTNVAMDLAAVGRARASLSGSIYEVDKKYTKSGNDYVGRNNTDDPAKNRKSNDGRDRTKAQKTDTYDKTDVQEGRFKEQRKILEKGGIEKLDNKRNEVNMEMYEKLKVKYGQVRLLPLRPEVLQKKRDTDPNRVDPNHP